MSIASETERIRENISSAYDAISEAGYAIPDGMETARSSDNLPGTVGDALTEAYSAGHDTGYGEGYDDGYNGGYSDGYNDVSDGEGAEGDRYEDGYNDGMMEGSERLELIRWTKLRAILGAVCESSTNSEIDGSGFAVIAGLLRLTSFADPDPIDFMTAYAANDTYDANGIAVMIMNDLGVVVRPIRFGHDEDGNLILTDTGIPVSIYSASGNASADDLQPMKTLRIDSVSPSSAVLNATIENQPIEGRFTLESDYVDLYAKARAGETVSIGSVSGEYVSADSETTRFSASGVALLYKLCVLSGDPEPEE